MCKIRKCKLSIKIILKDHPICVRLPKVNKVSTVSAIAIVVADVIMNKLQQRKVKILTLVISQQHASQLQKD
jgi:hypothetical protein